MPAHHFFGIVMFVFNNLIQMSAILQKPKAHVEAVLRVHNPVRRRHMGFQFRKNLAVQRRIGWRNSQFYLGALPQELLDDWDTTSRMTQAPVQRRHQNFHYQAPSQRFAQSP